MLNAFLLNPRECQGRTWHPPLDFAFAASRERIPLHGRELARAATCMPLALERAHDSWQLVGVCGLACGHNLFVRDGNWLGNYRPDWLYSWPFRAVTHAGKGYVVFEQSSGFEALPGEGEPFFDDGGEMKSSVACRVEMLKAAFTHQRITCKAVNSLAAAGVLVQWPNSLLLSLGMTLSGLYMIDEQALAQLNDKVFLNLRRTQALPIAYTLNLSMMQTHLLAHLARTSPPLAVPSEGLDDVFEYDEKDILFDFDR